MPDLRVMASGCYSRGCGVEGCGVEGVEGEGVIFYLFIVYEYDLLVNRQAE